MFNTIYIKNNLFKQKIDKNVEELRQSNLILRRAQDNGVSSYSFKKSVFYNNDFNQVTIRARGIFIYDENTKYDGQICARSFNKFFNVYLNDKFKDDKDRDFNDTNLINLKSKIVFPVTGYFKENGYLGIVSYNKVTNDFFVSSKSQSNSPFSQWLYEIIQDRLTDELKEYLSMNNVSLIFEVIDAKNDNTHMVDYNGMRDVILLDIVKNDFSDTFASYGDILKFGQRFNFKVKKQITQTLNTFEELEQFLKQFESINDIKECFEGFVFHDNNNFMFKYKTAWYRYWKNARNILTMVQNNKQVKTSRYEEYTDFIVWLLEHRSDLFDGNKPKTIIEVRKQYQTKG